MDQLNASSRVAIAAFLHDFGKFAERAKIEVDPSRLDALKTYFCPYQEQGRFHTHIHAAYTALAFDEVEAYFPNLIDEDPSPFEARPQTNVDNQLDNLVNAAAYHHKPQTFLQWVIATADRVASGFERETFEQYNLAKDENPETGRNHYQARQLTLFEQVNHPNIQKASDLKYCYPLKPLSAQSIFPLLKSDYEPKNDKVAQQQYRELWDEFKEQLKAIPASHRANLALWLDHFDSLWMTFTHAIPAATAFGTKPDVSLYDHSKTTSALATALWCYHSANHTDNEQTAAKLATRNTEDYDEQKFLMIQGDFFGVQDFIFSEGNQTNKNAAKILRGRSFQVSLFTELAALKVLEALKLPSTSQIINAAGKFLIVAANTEANKVILQEVQKELNAWFMQHSFGIAGMGLAWAPASCNDFLSHKDSSKSDFSALMRRLFEVQEHAKFQRLGLCSDQALVVLDAEYPQGACAWNQKLPATTVHEGHPCAQLTLDQITIGHAIARMDRLMVLDGTQGLHPTEFMLGLDVFGYRVMFTHSEEITGKFADLARSGCLRRCWDFSSGQNEEQILWNGYGRRSINGYVPRFGESDAYLSDKYQSIKTERDDSESPYRIESGAVKTFDHLACEDLRLNSKSDWEGVIALTTLKGDVDNLGQLFQSGLSGRMGSAGQSDSLSLAKMAALSRQVNGFFATYLPVLCATQYPDVYTVFAGGDDFFMIGPWLSTQKFAAAMRHEFSRYVAQNDQIHFSAGMSTTKVGAPIATMARMSEEAQDKAKSYTETITSDANGSSTPVASKNAVTLYDQTFSWRTWETIDQAQHRLGELTEQYQLSTAYVYSLLSLIDLSQSVDKDGNAKLEAAMWRSRFFYKTYRMLETKVRDHAGRDLAMKQFAEDVGEAGIARLGGHYRVALYNHFYAKRSSSTR